MSIPASLTTSHSYQLPCARICQTRHDFALLTQIMISLVAKIALPRQGDWAILAYLLLGMFDAFRQIGI